MKTHLILSMAVVALCAVSAGAAEIGREDLQKALEANPDLVVEALGKSDPSKLMDVIRTASKKEQEIAAQKELDDAFKNPLKPEISSKDHVRGSKKAKYTLVEYSDFQCPYCGRGFQTVEELRKKYGAQLRFIYKNDPLPMHPEAMPAAKYFEAVAIQSPEKAWEFHDKMFQNQQKLGEQFYKDTAKELGLDVEKLEKDAKSDAVKNRIESTMKEAQGFGIQGTPGFILNGIPVHGAYPVDYFEKIIDRLNKGS